jgi:integrase
VLTTHFRNFCAEHGFDITFHALRHSCAIAMLSSGVDVKTAAGRLGHSPRVLLATYAHHTFGALTSPLPNGSVPGSRRARLLTRC